MADPSPTFKYHPDPVASGSVKESPEKCPCCKQARGYLYDGPIYGEKSPEFVCPWCIADGKAHKKYKAEFVDYEGFGEGIPEAVQDEIAQRTPGYAAWQSEAWPGCCGDATAFLRPIGYADIRKIDYTWEGLLMPHIVHNMGISGGAATRLLQSLDRDKGPTAYVFKCLKCEMIHFHIDQP